MAHHVQVRVVNRAGAPLRNERVSIFTPPIAGHGGIPDQTTNDQGVADFDLEIADVTDVIVYVRGRERCSRGPLLDRYDISV